MDPWVAADFTVRDEEVFGCEGGGGASRGRKATLSCVATVGLH